MSYKVIIPARYASTRLPGKPLLDIAGRPLLQHVYESARRSSADAVIIATDDDRIRMAAQAFGAEVCMTAAEHASGSERLAEAVSLYGDPDDTVIVNLQGDEFGMPPALLDQVANLLLASPDAALATLCESLQDEADFQNPNVVKVVFDRAGYALYFSRAAIPWRDSDSKADTGFRHLGLYAYRAGFLKQYVNLSASTLEQQERLEQLRALDHGFRIRIAVACDQSGVGIDTPEDLQKARNQVTSDKGG
jgi:3-deoxy-manno-octulosonate cytidylyltransferase (CMP-KDO synthetase)